MKKKCLTILLSTIRRQFSVNEPSLQKEGGEIVEVVHGANKASFSLVLSKYEPRSESRLNVFEHLLNVPKINKKILFHQNILVTILN